MLCLYTEIILYAIRGCFGIIKDYQSDEHLQRMLTKLQIAYATYLCSVKEKKCFITKQHGNTTNCLKEVRLPQIIVDMQLLFHTEYLVMALSATLVKLRPEQALY